MSFINLLSNDDWTEFKIIARTEAMITSEFPQDRLAILTRKVTGLAFGYEMTADEQAELAAYQAVCYQAGAAADAARADMALLASVLAYEQAVARLDRPEVTEPATVIINGPDGVESEVPNPAIALDAAERAAAIAASNGLAPEVIDLWALRHPVVVEVVQEAAP